MNRAERRRLQKLAGKAGKNSKPAPSTGQSPDQDLELGQQHHAAGNLPLAASIYHRILRDNPNHPAALHSLGLLAHQTQKHEVAVDLISKSLAIQPGLAEPHNNLGIALQALGRQEEAMENFQTALSISPDYSQAHNNLGNTLRFRQRYDDALASLDQAIALDADYGGAYLSRALIRLSRGDYGGGWADYLHRDSVLEAGVRLDRNVLASDLSGKRIALFRDQGLGDEIFFLRFAGELKRRGAWVAYNPDPKIAGMIGRLDFIDDIMGDGGPAEGCDLRCSVGDLPYLLSSVDTPAPLQLSVLPERDDEITGFLRDMGPPPYIGCTWRAGVPHGGLLKLSPQAAMAEILAPLDGTILILQRNPRDDEIAEMAAILGGRLHDASRYNDDLEGMLALLGRIDDYVCVSNTNTHLRAARGLTSRVLIPRPPDFRWMESGRDSPWFPGATLYRETVDGGWDSAFKDLGRDLLKIE